uniref:Uncharacterized protein n=1 Tax=Nelumbo nucifera TaxID=4432 RepID=A0A822XQA0_NELNU|nr:TPA_asm: hypothetical protein HUJ06_022578 [Nelumbo nucifera]
MTQLKSNIASGWKGKYEVGKNFNVFVIGAHRFFSGGYETTLGPDMKQKNI